MQRTVFVATKIAEGPAVVVHEQVESVSGANPQRFQGLACLGDPTAADGDDLGLRVRSDPVLTYQFGELFGAMGAIHASEEDKQDITTTEFPQFMACAGRIDKLERGGAD